MARILLIISVCLLVLAGGAPAIAADVADLQEQLESELQARRPVEFAFIDRVCDLVETDVLPVDLVNTTFLWARPKRPRPYVYFERAMRIRAAKRGVQL